MNFPAITVDNSNPFIFDPRNFAVPAGSVALLQIANDSGGGVLYYGDTPEAAFSIDNFSFESGDTKVQFISPVSAVGTNFPGKRKVKAGMVVSSGGAFTAGTFVKEVFDTHFTLSTATIDVLDQGTITFTPPAISATNGIAIAAGGRETFESSASNKYLDGPLTLVCPTGTATVRIRYKLS